MKKFFGVLLALSIFFTNALAFTDVSSSHWAEKYITSMSDIGVVSGVGNGRFDPEAQVTTAQFVTMIVRHFYEDNLNLKILDTNWYVPFMKVANDLNLLEGVAAGTEEPINRYDMAQIMFNTVVDLNRDRPGTAYELSQGEKKIADWSSVPANYKEAVALCYTLELLSGVDSVGTFNGEGLMTRAQAAVVMNALINGPAKEEPAPQQSQPVVTGDIPAGAYILTDKNTKIIGDASRYEDGVFYLDESGIFGTGGYIQFTNPGYSTLTFTVTTNGKLHKVSSGSLDTLKGDQRLLEVQEANTSVTYTVDISGIKSTSMCIFNGRTCDAIVTNIYLT